MNLAIYVTVADSFETMPETSIAWILSTILQACVIALDTSIVCGSAIYIEQLHSPVTFSHFGLCYFSSFVL
jgi:hypothetical protein